MLRSITICLFFFFATAITFGQEKVQKKYNQETNLIEATYFHENGQVSQEGTFNADGKLHGEWTSYDAEGNKLAFGSYENGIKTGTWYFWTEDSLREVEFSNNQIASVNEEKKSSGVVKH